MPTCPLAADWGNVAEWVTVVVSLLAAIATVAAVWVALRSSDKEHRRTLELRDAEWRRQDAARVESASVWAVSFDLELRAANDILGRLTTNLRSAIKHAEPYEAFEYLNSDMTLKGQLPLLRMRVAALDDFQPEIRSRLLDVLSWWDRMSDLAESARVTATDLDPVSATDALATVAAQFELLSESIDRQRSALKPFFPRFPGMDQRTPETAEEEFQARRQSLFDLSPFPRRD